MCAWPERVPCDAATGISPARSACEEAIAMQRTHWVPLLVLVAAGSHGVAQEPWPKDALLLGTSGSCFRMLRLSDWAHVGEGVLAYV